MRAVFRLGVIVALAAAVGGRLRAQMPPANADDSDYAFDNRRITRTVRAELPASFVPDKMFGVWWRGGPDEKKMKELCPYIRGVFVALRWSLLEPEPNRFDWDYFDREIGRYARAGFYVQTMIWVGENSPRWLYQQGVPEVETTPSLTPHGTTRHEKYPFYLDPHYREFYLRMIRRVAAHTDTMEPSVRQKLISLQTAEGNTGDETGYKGEPINPAYRLPDQEWRAFKFEAWTLFAALFEPKRPKIHLLINSGNGGEYNDWILAHMPDTWRKAGNPGHGFQLNNEMDMVRFLDPLINRRNVNGEFVRARSEMDEAFKGWFKEAPVWNQYWLNLWGLTFGLDIFQHETAVFNDPRLDSGFVFYDRYGGEKDPATSPGAFCALHDGLDAADEKRFPVERFGAGGATSRPAEVGPGMARSRKIAESLAKFGARQGDPEKGAMLIMRNRDMRRMNDVGFNIWTDNYQRYLRQIDPAGTSQGYWRVGSPEQPYGRFARGFDVESGKNEMDFDLDDKFFAGTDPIHHVTVRIIYFDQGFGSWALRYDAAGSANKAALEVTNTGTGQWKEVTASLPDAKFRNGGPHHSDLSLVNTSRENTIFHLIEVLR